LRSGAIAGMKVEWTVEAKNALFQVTEYIREENPSVARKIVSHIHQATSRLSQNPYLGPISRKYPKYRELVASRFPFVIWYEVFEDEGVVEITLVWHSAQNREEF